MGSVAEQALQASAITKMHQQVAEQALRADAITKMQIADQALRASGITKWAGRLYGWSSTDD